MRRILLTGGTGQVGWELQRTLATLGQVITPTSVELDLRQPQQIREQLRSLCPDIIVNPAAYTAVDRAESEREQAMAINSTAPAVLAEEALKLNALLVHYSTDYVFDGNKTGSYTEEDATAPLNVYGDSKLAGENAIRASGCRHLILRTSWVYGLRGSNFLLTMLRLARERRELRIVNDQIGAPTWSRALAELTAQMLAQLTAPGAEHAEIERLGTYHASAAGSTSWHGFAAEIMRLAQPEPAPMLHAIPSSDYPTPAMRPRNSCLDSTKLQHTFGLAMPDWRTSLQQCLQEVRS